MINPFVCSFALLALPSTPAQAHRWYRPEPATPAKAAPTPTPLDELGPNLIRALTGERLFFYAGAVAVTGGMAFSGADHAVRVGVQRHLVVPAWGQVAYYGGYILPAVAAPAVYLVGLASGDRDLQGSGSAAVQALAITLGVTGVLKVSTGRAFPLNGESPTAPDRLDHPEYARTFHPFQPARGWSWPSGHAAASFSIAAALSAYFSGDPWIVATTYPVALGIGLGTVEGDNHWMSDVVAGALIGHAIGWSVGRAFRSRAHADVALPAMLVPTRLPGGGLELDWVGRF